MAEKKNTDKFFYLESVASVETKVSKDDLAKINKWTVAKLQERDVRVYTAILIDNTLTRNNTLYPESFQRTILSLPEGKGSWIGAPIIYGENKDHETKAKNQVGRIFEASMAKGLSENIGVLARFYVPTTETKLIEKLDRGINKEVSIGVSVEYPRCSICGQNIKECDHVPGKEYNSEKCFIEMNGNGFCQEVSIVAVPGNGNAKVLNEAQTADYVAIEASRVEYIETFLGEPITAEEPSNPEPEGMLLPGTTADALDVAIQDPIGEEPPMNVEPTGEEAPVQNTPEGEQVEPIAVDLNDAATGIILSEEFVGAEPAFREFVPVIASALPVVGKVAMAVATGAGFSYGADKVSQLLKKKKKKIALNEVPVENEAAFLAYAKDTTSKDYYCTEEQEQVLMQEVFNLGSILKLGGKLIKGTSKHTATLGKKLLKSAKTYATQPRGPKFKVTRDKAPISTIPFGPMKAFDPSDMPPRTGPSAMQADIGKIKGAHKKVRHTLKAGRQFRTDVGTVAAVVTAGSALIAGSARRKAKKKQDELDKKKKKLHKESFLDNIGGYIMSSFWGGRDAGSAYIGAKVAGKVADNQRKKVLEKESKLAADSKAIQDGLALSEAIGEYSNSINYAEAIDQAFDVIEKEVADGFAEALDHYNTFQESVLSVDELQEEDYNKIITYIFTEGAKQGFLDNPLSFSEQIQIKNLAMFGEGTVTQGQVRRFMESMVLEQSIAGAKVANQAIAIAKEIEDEVSDGGEGGDLEGLEEDPKQKDKEVTQVDSPGMSEMLKFIFNKYNEELVDPVTPEQTDTAKLPMDETGSIDELKTYIESLLSSVMEYKGKYDIDTPFELAPYPSSPDMIVQELYKRLEYIDEIVSSLEVKTGAVSTAFGSKITAETKPELPEFITIVNAYFQNLRDRFFVVKGKVGAQESYKDTIITEVLKYGNLSKEIDFQTNESMRKVFKNLTFDELDKLRTSYKQKITLPVKQKSLVFKEEALKEVPLSDEEILDKIKGNKE
ncbi:MAG: hypothetical protein KAU20_06500 [Nanoarchaeota archaeon]|nr:hypothetical protein [Nanoarchaeota archaeon]